MTLQVTQRADGLTIASDHMATAETVSLGVWVSAGTRYEAQAVNGIAHLLEHMAFKGTARRSAFAIAQEIEAPAPVFNAALQMHYAAMAQGYSGMDTASLYEVYKRAAGIEDIVEPK